MFFFHIMLILLSLAYANKLFYCSLFRCHSVRYCSAECQKKHWKQTHKKECSTGGIVPDMYKEIIKRFDDVIGQITGRVTTPWPIGFVRIRNGPGMVGSAFILPHHDVLLPKWEQFIKALSESTFDLECFSICNIQVPNVILDKLVPLLKGRKLKGLVLNNNDFGEYGLRTIVDILENNEFVEKMNLEDNKITDEYVEAVHLLSQAISVHPKIYSVQLENCDLGCNVDALKALLSSLHEKRLDIGLSNNQMWFKKGAVETLVEFLSSNPKLDELWISNNSLSDEYAIKISEALKGNTNLVKLNVHANNFTNRGKLAFRKLVYDDSSLAAVQASNHTIRHLCVERKRYAEWMPEEFVSDVLIGQNDSEDPEENKKFKMKKFLEALH